MRMCASPSSASRGRLAWAVEFWALVEQECRGWHQDVHCKHSVDPTGTLRSPGTLSAGTAVCHGTRVPHNTPTTTRSRVGPRTPRLLVQESTQAAPSRQSGTPKRTLLTHGSWFWVWSSAGVRTPMPISERRLASAVLANLRLSSTGEERGFCSERCGARGSRTGAGPCCGVGGAGCSGRFARRGAAWAGHPGAGSLGCLVSVAS